jgi:hypothetical protein
MSGTNNNNKSLQKRDSWPNRLSWCTWQGIGVRMRGMHTVLFNLDFRHKLLHVGNQSSPVNRLECAKRK